jgi:small subunit ribosomal protein S4
LRFVYGLTNNQLRNLFQKVRRHSSKGESLLPILESRLDNVVYRLNFAKTRFHARQLVSHKHVLVNNKVINIPSYLVNVNDQITLKPKMKTNNCVIEALEGSVSTLPHVSLEKEKVAGTYLRSPQNEEVGNFNETLIAKFFTR